MKKAHTMYLVHTTFSFQLSLFSHEWLEKSPQNPEGDHVGSRSTSRSLVNKLLLFNYFAWFRVWNTTPTLICSPCRSFSYRMMPLLGNRRFPISGLVPPSPGNSAMQLRFQNVRRGSSRCSKRCSSFFCRNASYNYCFLNTVNELLYIPWLSVQTIHHLSTSEKDGHQERYAETGARLVSPWCLIDGTISYANCYR